jgi:acyl-[acyl carrier protein]--UDP-N-acetylglucosamine O-acyltransferase
MTMSSTPSIHPTALIDTDAVLGRDVEVGPFSIVGAGVTVGDGSRIGSHCELGVQTALARQATLAIGAGSIIRSHSRFYTGSTFRRIETGHGVTVRENTTAGDDFKLGTLGDVQGDCSFGDYVRLHSKAFVAKGSALGDFVWLFPGVMLANDPHPPSDLERGVHIENYASVGACSVVLPGARLGEGCFVGALSVVGSVPAAMFAVGNPAQIKGPVSRIRLKDSGEPAYPWRRHFHRGYPADVVARWKAEFGLD